MNFQLAGEDRHFGRCFVGLNIGTTFHSNVGRNGSNSTFETSRLFLKNWIMRICFFIYRICKRWKCVNLSSHVCINNLFDVYSTVRICISYILYSICRRFLLSSHQSDIILSWQPKSSKDWNYHDWSCQTLCHQASDCKYFFSRPASKSCTNVSKDAFPKHSTQCSHREWV